MDEQGEKKGSEDVAQKASESVKDTAQAVKDGANLAKDISTGNVVGIAKNAVNLLKNKTVRKRLIVSILGNVLITVLLVCLLFSIFNAVGEAVKKVVNGIVAFFTIDDEGAIQISDEQIDAIIKSIQALGIDLNDLKLMGDVDYSKPNIQQENLEALRKYIRKFYEAQAVTETINIKPGVAQELAYKYGQVYLYRKNGLIAEEKRQLKYMKYDEFNNAVQKINNGIYNSSGDYNYILDYFSINNANGKLVYASISETQEFASDGLLESTEVYLDIHEEDYKSVISPYTTTMQFLLYLTMITQNPEFVSAFADLVKDCRIEITLMDNTYTTRERVTNKYTQKTKTVTKKTIKNKDTGKKEIIYIQNAPKIEEKIEERTIVKSEMVPTIAVTYVKTWFCEQTIEYVKEEKQSTPDYQDPDDSWTINKKDEKEPDWPATNEYVTTWKTNISTIHEIWTSKIEYKEGIRGQVIDRTGQKGDGDKSFIGLLDKEFKIPNTNRKEAAGSNLVSGADWLFELLKLDSNSQTLEQLMRVILNKYTGTDRYGDVTWNDISSNFNIKMISTGEDYIVDTTKSDSKLVITDKEVLKEAISKAFSSNDNMVKNLTDNVDNLIKMQESYNVNAVFAIAVSVIESHAGTDTTGAVDYARTYNWWNVVKSPPIPSDYKNLFDVTEKEPNVNYYYHNPNSSNKNNWMVYNNVGEAINRFGNLIANQDDSYFKANHYTVSEIAQDYNSYNAEDWTNQVISYMNKIYKAAGIETKADGFIIGGIQTEEDRQEMQDYIEKELINTQEHRGDYKYQDGPFEKWWKNSGLDPFQCTWWANGRASMYLEKNGARSPYPTIKGNGGEYYDINETNGWFNSGKTPKANSIVSWKGGSEDYGHVAYVEGVTSDGIYISHAGNGDSWYGITKIPLDGSFGNYRLNGYIYLDEPKN